jgi:hypothetical protein
MMMSSIATKNDGPKASRYADNKEKPATRNHHVYEAAHEFGVQLNPEKKNDLSCFVNDKVSPIVVNLDWQTGNEREKK